ncbi:MAG: tetratricopeptide repeat protein [Planctomycetaceae bacterium]|nr:MAG: tetratricopeptide repeat protein [Planctomycetaceae bacterium]
MNGFHWLSLPSTLLAIWMASQAVAQQPWYGDAASPLEGRLLEEMAEGRLERFSLLEAGLIASGVDCPVELSQYVDRFTTVTYQAFLSSDSVATDAAIQADELLQRLHRLVLIGDYDPFCTEIDRTLATGTFNCVTSTILFQYLARLHGLTVTTIGQPDHVFCRIPGYPPITIETTSPQGRIEGEFDRTGRGHWGSHGSLSPDVSTDERVLTDVQLIAKIYYNRAVVLLKADAHAAALPWLLRATGLDPDDTLARNNLLACLNNWALEETRSEDFLEALRLLEQGKAIAPDYEAFTHNAIYVYLRWAEHLAAQQRLPEALQVLDEARQQHPTVSLFDRARTSLTELGVDDHLTIQPARSR